MVVDKPAHSTNPLEQFLLLAKSVKGAACVELIKQVLETPGVYVFGELLDMSNVQELANGATNVCWNTLNLFAYGTYKDYLMNQGNFMELNDAQKKKLQHLTIVALGTKSKCISYKILLEELGIKNVRDLEDLIIEAIYADVIHGKLDQNNSQLEIDYAIGRDIKPEDVNTIISCLQKWCIVCENVLNCVESQIHRGDAEKNSTVQRKIEIDREIKNIKKKYKAPPQVRVDCSNEIIVIDDDDDEVEEKKSTKTKGGARLLR